MPDPPNEGSDQPRPLGADGKPVPGPQQVQQTLAQKRMAQQQAQVDQVVDIMRSNVEKVIERDVKLHKLDERAEQLESGASQFEMHMGKLKKNLWRSNMKWVVLLGLIVVALVILVVVGRASSTVGLVKLGLLWKCCLCTWKHVKDRVELLDPAPRC